MPAHPVVRFAVRAWGWTTAGLLLAGVTLGVSRHGDGLLPAAKVLLLPGGLMLMPIGVSVLLRPAADRLTARAGAALAVATGVMFAVWGALAVGAPQAVRGFDLLFVAALAVWLVIVLVVVPLTGRPSTLRYGRARGPVGRAVLQVLFWIVLVVGCPVGAWWSLQPLLGR